MFLQEPRAVLILRGSYVYWTEPWEIPGLRCVTPERAARANLTITGSSEFTRTLSSSGGASRWLFSFLQNPPTSLLDNFEILIQNNIFYLRCIPCKGSRYPPTLPRPAVAVLPFKLPYCQTTTEKGQMEVLPVKDKVKLFIMSGCALWMSGQIQTQIY